MSLELMIIKSVAKKNVFAQNFVIAVKRSHYGSKITLLRMDSQKGMFLYAKCDNFKH